MCNTLMEREFCGLFGNDFKKCENLYYEAEFAFFWQVVELENELITRFW